MLTYTQVLVRALKISASLLFTDMLIAFLVRDTIYPLEVFGDLLVAETALLFLLAGFMNFATSVALVQFRKSVLGSKETLSTGKRKGVERRAITLVSSGMILLTILIMLAVFRI